jgi:trehalose 6-phosphate synthase/phosphatase
MARLLIVSNRLPVTVKVEQGKANVAASAGGLATAMRGPHERLEGLWLGWPGDLSKLAPEAKAEAFDRLAAMRLVPIELSTAEITRYYDGFSNGVLWPLFHYLVEKVRLDARRDWEAYRDVNAKFADAVVERYRPGDVVWIHDYQLTLVPAMIRARIPEATIGWFLHVPWPSSEVFRILPWREEVLAGILGADLVGFHTVSHRQNFATSAARVLGLEPDVDALAYDGRTVRLGCHPIGIDAKEFERLAGEPAVRAEADRIREAAGGRRIVLGVDRLDYTKGIPRRLLAIERFLERNPELRGQVRYVQVAVPTREKVDTYAAFRREVHELVGRINGRFGTVSGVPIHWLDRSVTPETLVALYAAADVMLVTPLRDGMNLVAKEYVASRTDERGVLVLSEFAGAIDTLTDALRVNPYDLESVARALEAALSMDPAEQATHMRALRAEVFTHDADGWAQRFVADLSPEPTAAGRPSMDSLAPPPVEVLARFEAAEDLVFFLDYDGTLVPLASTPDAARPDPQLRALLGALAARPGTQVEIVSGRPREDLERFFGDLAVGLHAEHGFWTRRPGQAFRALGDPRSGWKREVRPILEAVAARTPRAFVEEKSIALGFHYRLADVELASARLRELRLALVDPVREHGLELLPGNKILEVRPRGVHKGAIVAEVLRQAATAVATIAIGDDRTDEDLFAALPASGLSIHVGRGTTTAHHRVPSPAAVRALLERFVTARVSLKPNGS